MCITFVRLKEYFYFCVKLNAVATLLFNNKYRKATKSTFLNHKNFIKNLAQLSMHQGNYRQGYSFTNKLERTFAALV